MWLGFGGDQGAVRLTVRNESSWAMSLAESTYEVVGSMERTSLVVEIDCVAESWTVMNGRKK